MSEPNKMEFPDTFEEYVKIYGIKDTARIYTNGSILIPALRVQQWIEHICETNCCANMRGDNNE